MKNVKTSNSEIKFLIDLDENKVPVNIQWVATDNNNGEPVACKAFMTSLWESDAKSTLRIDLWTKDMPIDEMKVFFHQSLLSMADTFERATGEKAITGDLRDYCVHFADKMNILQDQ